jgi:protein phosphatase
MELITPREPQTPRHEATLIERSAVAEQAVFVSRENALEIAVVSDCSRRRSINEDARSSLDGPSAVYVVADGVGGGAMAAWASRELVRRLHARLDSCGVDPASIRAALLDADGELRREIARETACAGAATVALCASIGPSLSNWLVAWVGDCRIYRVRSTPSDAELLTRDDTYGSLGERPPPGGSPNDPARMVGNGAVVAPNVEGTRLRDGETLALCSDGLHRHVDVGEIGAVLRGHAPLARGCERLLELARSRSADDDATLLVVRRTVSRRNALSWMKSR